MQSEWLFVGEKKDVSVEVDINAKVQCIMDQIDEGRGWRYTEEQAETLGKLVDKLVKQVKTQNKKANAAQRKSFFTLPFFSIH